VTIRDFRNLASVDAALPPDGVAILGENGHGKTNFLEALYYLEILRSFRGARDSDLVRFGSGGFHLSASLGGSRSHDVAAGFDRPTKRKKVTIDGAEPDRLADAIGAFPAVIFSPADVDLIAGSPSERRRFLDVMLSLGSRGYLGALQRYRAALARRNAALRDANGARDPAAIEVWEPTLAQSGAVLTVARQRWTEEHGSSFASLCEAIGERAAGALHYESALRGSLPDVQQELANALARKRASDVQRGMTQSGPHRDDLRITLEGRDMRAFGSAGQQRTAAIVLRLLEASTLREASGAEPVILLDDPFAELDQRRTTRILGLLQHDSRSQIVLAIPRASDIPEDLTRLERWHVRDGEISGELR
jgi:DNA replication and repair protein RecF